MRVLLVKLSSLGDVIHNLPVVSDLARACPQVEIDWAIESPYAEIAALHPQVKTVLPVPMRQLKRNGWSIAAWNEFMASRSRIKSRQYDHILDSQGLIKSRWVAGWAEGPIAGYSASSAREPWAARFYDQPIEVPGDLHAVVRNRLLAARTFGYTPGEAVDYGITVPTSTSSWLPVTKFVVFLHATSRANKRWPDHSWIQLGTRLQERGFGLVLPWGSNEERTTSQRLAGELPGAIVTPAMSLNEAAVMLAKSSVVVGVDTGLAHPSVALGRPTIGLYVTTEPRLTGLYGSTALNNLGGGSAGAPLVPEVHTVLNAVLNLTMVP